MKVLIEAVNTPTIYQFDNLTAVLRIEAIEGFTTSDGQVIPPGTNGQQDFYLEVAITVLAGVMQIPLFEIDSTEDAYPWHSEITGDMEGYRATIALSNGRKIPYLPKFKVPTLAEGDPSLTWAEIRIFNRVFRRRFTGLDRMINVNMAQEWIQNAVGELNRSSDTNTGVTALTHAPLDPTFPIAVAANDPDWLSLVGTATQLWLDVTRHGLVGDGVTDNTVALQALLDLVDSANEDATLFFPAGDYVIAGDLQDVALSNSQLVLPKRNSPEQMLAIRLLGETPSAQAWFTSTGSILRSTLATGNGAMLGVRNDRGFPGGNDNNVAHNGCSWLSLHLENMTFRLPANPTNSCLDLRWLPNVRISGSVRVDVTGIDAFEGNGAGGAEGSGPVPDLRCTEPTTASSYGIKTPIDYNPNLCMIENVEVLGYYNAIQWGELCSGNNITIGACKVGLEVMGSQHPSNINKLLIVSTALPIKAGGADPVFAAGTPTTIINIQQLDIENSSGLMAWSLTTLHVDDPNNYLHGDINWFQGLIPAQGLIRNGAANLNFHNVTRAYHTRSPFVEITGGTQQFQDAGSDHAVDETYRGLPTSTNTRIAIKSMVSQQSGLAHLVGLLTYSNAAIAGNVDKRLAQIAGLTDGATNSGALEFYTMNAGVIARHAWFDRFGNFNLTRLMPRGEGPVIASGNVIAPTWPVHVVSGTGVIKTITVPNIPAGAVVTIALIPSGAWTYDNTGNIGGVVGGTAVVGKTMYATWVPSLSKWAMSY